MFEVHTGTYLQTWSDNMSIVGTPKKAKNLQGVKVSFIPDLEKFECSLDEFNTVIFKVLQSRVFDCVATTPDKFKVVFNGTAIKQKSLAHYVSMFLPEGEKPIVDLSCNHWKIAVIPSTTFKAHAFVNGIFTPQGTHVNHVVSKIVDVFADSKKFKDKDVRAIAKKHVAVFIVADIVNPVFDSQSKTKLTSPAGKFEFKYTLGDEFAKKIMKSDISDMIVADLEKSDKKEAAKSDGNARKSVVSVPKLRDAQFAGTKNGKDCTLVLTEGDSALTLVIAGISSLSRGFQYFGAFPLRGKLLNTLNASPSAQNNNAEFVNIKKILGLISDEVYTDLSIKTKLRYGRVMIAADADTDGSHICGLVANLFNAGWPSLLKQIPGFLSLFRTPIVIATKGGANQQLFYSLPDFDAWADTVDTKSYKIKYYKGLCSPIFVLQQLTCCCSRSRHKFNQ